MKTNCLLLTQRIWWVLLWAGLVTGPAAWAQSIPDIQWSKSGKTLAVTTDGNIATTEQIALPASSLTLVADKVIKYDLPGNQLWSVGPLKGGFYIGGKVPGVTDYESLVGLLPAGITGGGVAVAGSTNFRGGPRVATKIDANGSPRVWQESDVFFGGDIIDDIIGTPDGGFLLLTTQTTYTGQNASTKATIRKYDASGNFSWANQIAYPTPNPATPDLSLSKGVAVINTPDGGYLIVGYYNTTGVLVDLNNNTSIASTGWVAKVDGQGNATWQKLLDGLPFSLKSIILMLAATDVTLAADGNGYALVGPGIIPSAMVVAPARTSILELNADGSFKRARAIDLPPSTSAFITPYTVGGTKYYAVGNTANANPQILTVNTAALPQNDPDLFKVVAQRTFGIGGFLQGIATAGDGSLVFVTSNNQLVKLNKPADATNCDFAQPRRVGTWNGLEVQIRQYGDKRMLVTAIPNSATDKHYPRGDNFWDAFTKDSGVDGLRACLNAGNTSYGGVAAPDNLPTPSGYTSGREADGAFFFERSSGGGGNCDFAQPRRVGTWNGLDVQIRQYGDKRVLVTAIPNSLTDKCYPRGDNFWDAFTKDSGVDGLRACLNGGNTSYGGVAAPNNLPTPSGYNSGQEADGAFFFERSGTNPPGGGLALLAPTYNCTTGAIHFNTSGGNGSLIEFQSVGITGWTTNPDQFVDKDSRTANDVKPFTLMARQNGQVVTYSWDLKAACGRARVGADEPTAELQVRVLGNPVEGKSAEVEIRGASAQTVQLELIDLQGRVLHRQSISQAGSIEQVSVPIGNSRGLLLLHVSTATQRQQVKLLKL